MDNQTEGAQNKVSARRRSGREIDEWIERYRRSGQSAAAFASAHGVKVGTLRGWLYRRAGRTKSRNEAMIPVKLIDSAGRQPAVTLRLPSGIEIEFAAAVAVSTLKELIESGTRRC
jgi:hypothetical protein